ncbi:toll/interleukin-1 receptor domain-containing protein [Sphingobacterium sp.]|uniref:toll/interleukin-1 receptor domain-containing protein n=1 Tax=Sphingobacterium sp. TaxID=341027 RepID=UPI0028AE5DD9|nr:toll/interleukin-1 receptor domain-containing protein [Sphingobacterium sp.]
METKYQFIFIGKPIPFKHEIEQIFRKRIEDLGIDNNAILIIDEENFQTAYIANAPAFCLYYGDEDGVFPNHDILEILIDDATLILPVVCDLNEIGNIIPERLRKINAFKLTSQEEIEPLISNVLEGLGLLRLSRRLFVSYKRDESSSIAIQLFEQFEKSGFDVFLDTHSIRPGEVFQEELWHRLADTDIVVLLNTPGFLKSNWTKEELAQANSMSIGILQLIWPNHKLEREAELSIPFQLKTSDFGNQSFSDSKSFLNQVILNKIISEAESLRARSLAARHDNIVTEFVKSAHNLGLDVSLQPEKFLTMKKKDGKEIVIIPTVGVPQAFTYNQSEELVKRIKTQEVVTAYLLYDHRNVRKRWLDHLAWLDTYLPIKTIKIIEIESWLKKN